MDQQQNSSEDCIPGDYLAFVEPAEIVDFEVRDGEVILKYKPIKILGVIKNLSVE